MKPRTIRGVNDLLPDNLGTWKYLEEKVIQIVESYGFNEIRLPIMERTELFKRSIGEGTDIVEKEMYTFNDRNEESITLRPEATASLARAGITNGLLHNQQQKLWTMGPMFRYEKPQKGRYRQFYQFNIEAMGFEGPDVDAEIIILCQRMWKQLNINRISLKINSLGDKKTRSDYRKDLINYFSSHDGQLDQNSKNRLHQNPLRILDSKNPEMSMLIDNAPLLSDYLDSASKDHFEKLKEIISSTGIEFEVNPKLVRGLDYYSGFVFEAISSELGAQDSFLGGGRYDQLCSQLGGKDLPAIGMAIGLERLANIANLQKPNRKLVSFVIAASNLEPKAYKIAHHLRSINKEVLLDIHLSEGSLKSKMRKANKNNSDYAIIIGEEEFNNKTAVIKPLNDELKEQQTVSIEDLYSFYKTL